MNTKDDVPDLLVGVRSAGAIRLELYFADHDRSRLELIIPELARRGYSSIEIWDPSEANDDQELMFLHCEIVGPPTDEFVSLHCEKLEELASVYGIEAFDGYDVGNVDGSPIREA